MSLKASLLCVICVTFVFANSTPEKLTSHTRHRKLQKGKGKGKGTGKSDTDGSQAQDDQAAGQQGEDTFTTTTSSNFADTSRHHSPPPQDTTTTGRNATLHVQNNQTSNVTIPENTQGGKGKGKENAAVDSPQESIGQEGENLEEPEECTGDECESETIVEATSGKSKGKGKEQWPPDLRPGECDDLSFLNHWGTKSDDELLSSCQDDRCYQIGTDMHPCFHWATSSNQLCNGTNFNGMDIENQKLTLRRCPLSCHRCLQPQASIGDISNAELLRDCKDDKQFRSQMSLIDPSRGRDPENEGKDTCQGFEFEDCGEYTSQRSFAQLTGTTVAGGQAILNRCPRACRLCTSQTDPSEAELLSECIDDPGRNCSRLLWEDIKEDGKFTGWLFRVEVLQNQCTEAMSKFDNTNDFVNLARRLCPRTCGLCRRCEPGYRENWHTRDVSHPEFCEPCERGKFLTMSKVTECLNCEAGRYINSTGSTQCVNCDINFYSSAGSGVCLKCPPNSLTPGVGAETCLADNGYFAVNNTPGFLEFRACGNGKTTDTYGSKSIKDCKCGKGTYYDPASDTCYDCPEGLRCPGDRFRLGDTQYVTLPGYHAVYSENKTSAIIYLCMPPQTCEGDDACAPGFDKSMHACAGCLSGHFRARFSCKVCEADDHFITFLGMGGSVVFFSVAVMFMNKPSITMHVSAKIEVAVIGITVSAIQAIQVFGHLDIVWAEPLPSLFTLLSVFTFDLEIFRVSCVLGSLAHKPAAPYLRRVAVLPAASIFLTSIVAIKNFGCKHARRLAGRTQRHFRAEWSNTIGTIFMVFFIGLCMLAFLPFQCYSHPTPGYSSVKSYPEILCWKGDHSKLIGGSIFVLVTIVFPGLANCIRATIRYPRATILGDDYFMHAYQFLFARVKPEVYYSSLFMLLRSFCLVLVPTIFTEEVEIQVILVGVVLVTSCLMIAFKRPWRVSMSNLFDSCVSVFLVMLLICGALLTHAPPDSPKIQYVMGTVLVCLGSAVLGGFFYGAVQRCRPTPAFTHFICHHKEGEACQARLLQLLLESFTGDHCFIDSDHLIDLGALFDAVSSSVKNLVAFLGRDTIRRPWCVGEMATAHANSINIVPIRTSTFMPIQEKMFETTASAAMPTLLGEAGMDILTRYGIQLEAARVALDRVQKLPAFTLPRDPHVKHFYAACGYVIKESKGVRRVDLSSFLMEDMKALYKGAQKSIFICSALQDAEATAASLTLSLLLRKSQAMVDFQMVLLSEISEEAVMDELLYIKHDMQMQYVLTLSPSTLRCSNCASLVFCCWGCQLPIVAVALPGFAFPTEFFYETECYGLFNDMNHGKLVDRMDLLVEDVSFRSLAVAFQSLFQCIAIPFDTRGKIGTITSQAKEVADRIVSNSRGQHGTLSPQHSSASFSPNVSCSPRSEADIAETKQKFNFLSAVAAKSSRPRSESKSGGSKEKFEVSISTNGSKENMQLAKSDGSQIASAKSMGCEFSSTRVEAVGLREHTTTTLSSEGTGLSHSPMFIGTRFKL